MSSQSTSNRNTLTIEPRPRFRRLRSLLNNDQRRHRALFLVGMSVLAIVSFMAFLTYRIEQLPLDLLTTTQFQRIDHRLFAELMTAISLPGYLPWSVLVVGSSCLLVAYLLNWRDGAFLFAITVLGGLLNSVLKEVIGRPRPAENVVEVIFAAGGQSFPSGHVMFYTVFFGFLFFLGWTRARRSLWRVLLLLVSGALVLFVGPSRIYLGAHWLSDVVAGYLIGLVILLFAIEFYAKYLVSPHS